MPFASAREMPGKDDIPLYFENLTQLDEWYDRSSRPISGGLPPYIPRTEPQEGSFAGKLLICHDYKVRRILREYNVCSGASARVGTRKHRQRKPTLSTSGTDATLSSSENASYLRYTTMLSLSSFSHQRVTIPPPGWVNAAHRQGVKMLGVL